MSSTSTRVRVLVVDDLADDTLVMTKLLALLGCEVASGAAPREAVQAAQRFRPHLVMLDVRMSETSGVELARQLRQLNIPRFLLVARTMHADPATRDRCREAGFDLVIVKPVEIVELRELLETVRKFPFS